MISATGLARTALAAVLSAILGLSYSLASNKNNGASEEETKAREVGTSLPLSFANPFVAGPGSDRDLGDALAGVELARVIRAKGGVAPYVFSPGGGPIPPRLNLLRNGLMTGFIDAIYTPVGTNVNPVRFGITVTDSFGFGSMHTTTETFRLTVVLESAFRFANSALSDGVQFRPYSDAAAALNGAAPLTFTASNVLVNGAPTRFNVLEDVGLSMARDGTIHGVPLVSGTISFTANATDKNGVKARGRTGTGTGQSFSFNVTANQIVNSSITATSIVVNAGFGANKNFGSISYKGIANLGGEAIEKLSGQPFSLHIGSYASPIASFNTKGLAATLKRTIPVLQAKLSKTGALSATVKNDAINLDPIIITGGAIDLAVEIRLGDAVIGSEVLRFTVKSARQGVSLIYKADSEHDLGGVFQLTNVQGSDDRNQTGDAWKVSFIDRAPKGVAISSITQVEVAIGSGFDKISTPVKNSKGKISGKGPSKTSAIVTAFSIDLAKTGKGSYTTNTLPSTLTGIPTALKGGSGFFSTSVTCLDAAKATITAGESSIPIFVKSSKSWTSAP